MPYLHHPPILVNVDVDVDLGVRKAIRNRPDPAGPTCYARLDAHDVIIRASRATGFGGLFRSRLKVIWVRSGVVILKE
jgi:hypothetical protein